MPAIADEVIEMKSQVAREVSSSSGEATRLRTSLLSKALRCSNAALAVMTVFGCAASAVAQKPSLPPLERIDRDRLCVTNGAVAASAGGRLAIETPSSRAFVQAGSENTGDQIAEIHFQYLGPSQDSRPLASGELRRQIGIKLRAQDSCNLIYAMWHIDPDARTAVSIKRNAGLHTHEQCGARGYVNFKAQDRSSPPPIHPGEAHTLRAELRGMDLTVTADDQVVWQGSLGSELLPVGPPGFRTDNARFAFEFFAGGPAGSRAAPQHVPPGRGQCVISEGD
jgi:hypothetical protein